MNTLYVVLLFTACVYAASATECDTLARLLIKKEWASLFGTGAQREKFGTFLWREFFRRDPEARQFFGGVGGDDITSAKFTAHAQRVLGGLDMSISLLDDENTLNAELAHLKSQHDGRNIGREHYGELMNSLIYVLPDYLGVGHHDAGAWRSCLTVIVQGITGS